MNVGSWQSNSRQVVVAGKSGDHTPPCFDMDRGTYSNMLIYIYIYGDIIAIYLAVSAVYSV